MVLLDRVLRAFVWVLYALAIVAIVALAFGFVLALFGANQAVPFAKLVTDLTKRFMDPFIGLIKPTPMGTTGEVRWSELVAIAAYAVAAWLLSMLADWFSMHIDRMRSDDARRHKDAAAATTAAAAPYTPPVLQQPAVIPVVTAVPPLVQPVAAAAETAVPAPPAPAATQPAPQQSSPPAQPPQAPPTAGV